MVLMSAAALSEQVLDEIRQEIDSGSARATAIVGASFVEDHLQRLIQARLVEDKKVIDQIFGPNSALGTFSAKINVGYLMGLYSRDTYRELDCIRTIRNDFAHELHINSFDIDTIRDRCANLRGWERAKVTISPAEGDNDATAVEVGGATEWKPIIVDFAEGRDRAIARNRYVAACRFYIAFFALLLNTGKRPAIPEL